MSKVAIHEKYASRPKLLKDMCLAQFATFYDTYSRSKIKTKEFTEGCSKNVSSDKYIYNVNNENVYLPFTLKVIVQNQTYFMQLRNNPSILRRHKFKLEKDPHEFFYSELLLYRPWENEKELHPFDEEACINLYNESITINGLQQNKISCIKSKMHPHQNLVDEAMAAMSLRSDHHAEHIGDAIDPEGTKKNEDIDDCNERDTEYVGRDPSMLEHATTTEKQLFPRIDLTNIDAMLTSIYSLDTQQRKVFNIAIKFCKQFQQAKHGTSPKPNPPLVFVHGGAGTGKSKLINDIACWSEHILRLHSTAAPTCPLVVKVAPTGKAASIIGGLTLHAAFHFSFGNDHFSLPDSLRDNLRTILNDMQIVIIDEISMMKADQLYQLNLRLQELKQSTDLFGGLAIFLFGDLFQLQPVNGRWIYQNPLFC